MVIYANHAKYFIKTNSFIVNKYGSDPLMTKKTTCKIIYFLL